MRKYNKIFILIITVFFSLSVSGRVVDKTWYTTSTENLNIHFHTETEKTALELREFFEAEYNRLTKELEWQPQTKLEVVIDNDSDILSSYSSPAPHNKIYLNIFDKIDVTQGFLSNISQVKRTFTHECVHALHFDMTHGLPNKVARIFGRGSFMNFFAMPNAFQPDWLIEGLAIYHEGAGQPVGRSHSGIFEMMMRTEVSQGLRSVDELNMAPSIDWPYGKSYLYGAYFYEFLHDVYGDQKITAMLHQQASHSIPFHVNETMKKVFGRDLSTLWGEYQHYLKNKFQPQINTLSAAGLIAGKPVTSVGGMLGVVRTAPEGGIYYTSLPSLGKQALIYRSTKGQERLVWSSRNVNPMHFDVHNNKIIFVQADSVQDRVLSDIHCLDLKRGTTKQLTEGKRYQSVVWHSPTGTLLATQFYQDRWRLVQLSAQGQEQKILWQGAPHEVLGNLHFSASRNTLITTLQQAEQGVRLAEFHVQNQTWTLFHVGQGVVADPCYDPAGEHILFTADTDGVFNIQQLSLKTNEIDTLTHLMTGAFRPSLSADGHLYYYQYQAHGYDLHCLQVKHRQMTAKAQLKLYQPLSTASSFPTKNIKPYSSSSYLKPTWWAPIPLMTGSSDPVGMHQYKMWYFWRDLGALYTYSDDIVLGAKINFRPIYEVFGYRALPLYYKKDQQLGLLLAGKYKYKDGAHIYTPGIALKYNNTLHRPGMIGPSFGRKISLALETDIYARTTKYDSRCVFTWSEYLPVTARSILKLVLSRGWSSQRNSFKLGGPQSSHMQLISDSYKLRGYGMDHSTGQNFTIFRAEYQYPLWSIKAGSTTLPIGLQQIHGNVFFDSGHIWNGARRSPEDSSYLTSIGVEVFFDIVALYKHSITLGVGYGAGLSHSSHRVLVSLKASF